MHNEGMNIVGKNVHKYRQSLGLSLDELGKKAAWDKKNLHRLEQTGSGYSHESITRLAKSLGVSLGALFDEGGAFPLGRVVPIDFYTQEMIRRGADGKTVIDRPANELGGISDVLMTDGSFSSAAFAFSVNDDAMKPLLCRDDVVIVDPDLLPEPNDLVLAVVYRRSSGKSQCMVRKYAERGESFELIPNDDAYSSEIPSGSNIDIIGTVVEQRRQRRRA